MFSKIRLDLQLLRKASWHRHLCIQRTMIKTGLFILCPGRTSSFGNVLTLNLSQFNHNFSQRLFLWRAFVQLRLMSPWPSRAKRLIQVGTQNPLLSILPTLLVGVSFSILGMTVLPCNAIKPLKKCRCIKSYEGKTNWYFNFSQFWLQNWSYLRGMTRRIGTPFILSCSKKKTESGLKDIKHQLQRYLGLAVYIILLCSSFPRLSIFPQPAVYYESGKNSIFWPCTANTVTLPKQYATDKPRDRLRKF